MCIYVGGGGGGIKQKNIKTLKLSKLNEKSKK
jgi:hypothetical protein